MERKNHSNFKTYLLSVLGAIAIAISIVISLPTFSKANEPATCTAQCGSSGSVTCSGSDCDATDGIGCTYVDPSGVRKERPC